MSDCNQIFQRSVWKLSKGGADVLRGPGINLQANGIVVYQASQRHERTNCSIGVRANVPAKLVQPGKAFGKTSEIEFEADQAFAAVVAAANDFCGSQVEPGFPAVWSRIALIPYTSHSGQRFKQCRGLLDESIQPIRSTVAFPAITLVIFQLLQQVMNQQMRVRQGKTPGVASGIESKPRRYRVDHGCKRDKKSQEPPLARTRTSVAHRVTLSRNVSRRTVLTLIHRARFRVRNVKFCRFREESL